MIRQLDDNNVESFYQLFIETINSFNKYPQQAKDYFLDTLYTKEFFYQHLDNLNINFYINIQKGYVVGFLISNRMFGGVGFISWLGVSPSFRKQSIGTSLLKHYEDLITKKGGHLVEAYTFGSLEKFYEKNGYERVGYRKRGYFGVENIIMNKALN